MHREFCDDIADIARKSGDFDSVHTRFDFHTNLCGDGFVAPYLVSSVKTACPLKLSDLFQIENTFKIVKLS